MCMQPTARLPHLSSIDARICSIIKKWRAEELALHFLFLEFTNHVKFSNAYGVIAKTELIFTH